MRQRYIQDPDTLKLIPAEEYYAKATSGPLIMGDIQPYMSVTGEYIGGRRQHREFLKRNNFTEVGNEKITPKPMPRVPGLKDEVVRSYQTLKARKR